jgi:hypothetical protein
MKNVSQQFINLPLGQFFVVVMYLWLVRIHDCGPWGVEFCGSGEAVCVVSFWILVVSIWIDLRV